jgi:small subunit ribosomal protein S7
MPRRARKLKKKPVEPDPKYNDILLGKFINKIMLAGKKNSARTIMYEAVNIIGEKLKDDPIKIIRKAIDNVKPLVEVKSRRVGGATYQVPLEVRAERGEALAVQWIITYSRERSGHSMQAKLADEIIDAFGGKGSSMKKREDVHKMAEANKAFAHYRW